MGEGIVQSSLSPDQAVSMGSHEVPLMTESAPINFDEASYQQPIDEQSFDDISPQRKELFSSCKNNKKIKQRALTCH